jgi:hypothetical protein
MDLTNARPFEAEFIRSAPSEIRAHKMVMHFNSVIALLVNPLAVYIILKHSPPQIGAYKRYLLNIVVRFDWEMRLKKKLLDKKAKNLSANFLNIISRKKVLEYTCSGYL